MRNILLSTKKQGAIALLALLLITGSVAQAANVYMINGSVTGTSTQDWSNPTTWSNNADATDANPAAANDDYYVGRDENLAFLPPLANQAAVALHMRGKNNTVFGGKSLHVSNGVAGTTNFSIRPAAAPNDVITVPNLILTSGTINNHASNIGGTLRGHITLAGSGSISEIRASGNDTRSYTIAANITGQCKQLTLNMTNNSGTSPLAANHIDFTTQTNTFSVDTLVQTGGTFNVAGTGAIGHPGRFNTAGIVVPTAALDMSSTTVSLTAVTGVLQLDFPVNALSLFVTNGTATNDRVANGTYTAAQLAATYPGQFTGTSTITVGPAGPPPPNATKEWTIY